MEFLSNTEQNEYSLNPRYPYGKWYFYEQILQVPICMIFDPKQPSLEVYHLVHGHYLRQEADAEGCYYLAPLGLFLGTWYGATAILIMKKAVQGQERSL